MKWTPREFCKNSQYFSEGGGVGDSLRFNEPANRVKKKVLVELLFELIKQWAEEIARLRLFSIRFTSFCKNSIFLSHFLAADLFIARHESSKKW